MIICLGLAVDADAVAAHRPIAAGVLVLAAHALLLAALFGWGYFEFFVLKARLIAGSTWLMCLALLTGWIAYPLTTAAIVAATIVLASGLILLIVFYRRTDAH